MHRRDFLGSTSVGLATLAAPRLAQAQSSRVLRYVPHADLTGLDPVHTTALVTLIHGLLVFDTLYGRDAEGRLQPQMVEGHVVEQDGLRWTLTLREGLRFHDGEPVRGRDVVASLRRWVARDGFGAALMDAVEDLAAPTDRTIVFRLSRPFPLLPEALGKSGSYLPAIMPERLAGTDPSKQITEMVGSGPFRFLPAERLVGSRVVYERFAGYVPRQARSSFLAGAKVAHFDRIEWRILPDPATAAAALQANEVDWAESVLSDIAPVLRRRRNLAVGYAEDATLAVMRFNHLHPPFDNPAIRRALLGAVDQRAFMEASAGTDPEAWRDRVGAFARGTPMASEIGLDVLTSPRDLDRVRTDIKAAGYRGERVVVLNAADFPVIDAMTQVGADMLRRAGLNVDVQSLDWGSLVQRRAKREPVDQGGWSVFCTGLTGTSIDDPVGHLGLRGNGTETGSWFGWPTAPRLEDLRRDWLATADFDRRREICGEIQAQVWRDVPFLPLGQFLRLTAHRRDLQGVSPTIPLFFNLKLA